VTLPRKKDATMSTNYMVESMHGDAIGEGFASREEATAAAQSKANHLNQVVYVVRADGLPLSKGMQALAVEPDPSRRRSGSRAGERGCSGRKSAASRRR
jgi:hypothetical protein